MVTDTGPDLTTGAGTIGYRDGSEAYLLRFFEENAVGEYELFPKDAPWAIHYHLTPRRKTLLSWIDFGPGGRILELGAGCGALTAHLATLPHAVTAVEGSPERAAIIRARCRSARNLEIVAANAVGLPYDRSFDVATLVGVLEYAAAFVPGPRPHERLLAEARRYLKDDGCLILAIENRMGHKYLAGLPEDHTGRPYDGINGYPGPGAARTFDRPTLAALLARAGFPTTRWYYPSPDYKTPDAVVAERALATDGFAVLPLLELPTADYGGRFRPAFSERQFLRSALAGGAAGHYMNSFLVLAAARDDAPLLAANEATLAVAANVDSCPPLFQTMTRFTARRSGVAVTRRNLHGLPPAVFASGRQHVKAEESYHLGYVSVLETVLTAVEEGDMGQAAKALVRWMEHTAARARPATPERVRAFAAFCRGRLGQTVYPDHQTDRWLPGNLLDAHPGNVLVHPATGDIRYIDLEWQLACDIPLQLLLDRGVNLVGQKIALLAPAPPLPNAGGLPPALDGVLARHPLCRRADPRSLAVVTQWLFAAVTHGSLDYRLPPAAGRR
ncbi:Methyltransferase type 11 [Solidesulfovibrio carbinoliphilus subsp. oakridgensis]|uniref:Methyltransferase type 11 n=1 Tax=Solidesulfovibrio carbinoliphilus subsp. oakridgensis TaxID=694327 RepID=G7Q682_9BACT|nr:class I SAM-dependent methyltransferase [Solidesulfovibrio carbinoliphilus]EHJ47255.1 Methyltransferase type 11 [Solidesulfovibrio carbinoliphilus subsp. oakridgensis]